MDKTPLLLALDKIKEFVDGDIKGNNNINYRMGLHRAEEILKSLLSDEKKFALDFFITGMGVGALNEEGEHPSIEPEQHFEDKYAKLTKKEHP